VKKYTQDGFRITTCFVSHSPLLPNLLLQDLLNTYLLIDLNDQGLLLRFEPRTQRLHSIEVYDLKLVVLRYCGVAFSGPDTAPTFVLIYDRFGPSFPGEYNRERQTYCLDYPVDHCPTSLLPCATWLTCFLKGVMFTFPIPNEWDHLDEVGACLSAPFPLSALLKATPPRQSCPLSLKMDQLPWRAAWSSTMAKSATPPFLHLISRCGCFSGFLP